MGRPGASAPHLTFVFVGAGYAGVEALAELSDLVRDALRYYPDLRAAPQRWVLVDAAPKILPEIPTRLGEYAARAARSTAASRSASRRRSTSADGERAVLSDGTRIETDTLVWTAGVRAAPATRSASGCPLDDAGRVLVDATLRVEGRAASGRSATAPASRTRPRPNTRTRRRASTRSGRRGGWRRTFTGEPRPYRYRMLGQVATLGRYKGIADVLGVRMRGFSAGSSPARTTSTSCRSSRGSSASSSTGRCRSSSAGTSPSSRCSDVTTA